MATLSIGIPKEIGEQLEKLADSTGRARSFLALNALRRYLAMGNPSAATRIANHNRSTVPELAKQPGMDRPGRVPGTCERVLLDVPYIIAWRVEEDSVVVLRVLHTSRKWPETIT